METTEIEIERRFLLKKLPNIKWTKKLDMIQHYLSDKGADEVIRVRSIKEVKKRKTISEEYIHTTKTRVSEMAVLEKEVDLTYDEYKDILLASKRKISKFRYIKKVGKLKWEIDVFTSLNLIIAEIELPNEDYDVEIPEWLSEVMLLEITGMHQFSNSNLS